MSLYYTIIFIDHKNEHKRDNLEMGVFMCIDLIFCHDTIIQICLYIKEYVYAILRNIDSIFLGIMEILYLHRRSIKLFFGFFFP